MAEEGREGESKGGRARARAEMDIDRNEGGGSGSRRFGGRARGNVEYLSTYVVKYLGTEPGTYLGTLSRYPGFRAARSRGVVPGGS